MSDLQDLIARNAVMAYNQGVERGAAEERDRIIELLNSVAAGQYKLLEFSPNRKDGQHREMAIATIYQMTALIRGEQK